MGVLDEEMLVLDVLLPVNDHLDAPSESRWGRVMNFACSQLTKNGNDNT